MMNCNTGDGAKRMSVKSTESDHAMNYIRSEHTVPIFNKNESLQIPKKPIAWPLSFLYKSYATIKRTELCDCLLSVGPYNLERAMVICNDTGPESDRSFEIKFSFNKIVLHRLSIFLKNIQMKGQRIYWITYWTFYQYICLPSLEFLSLKRCLIYNKRKQGQ